MGFSMPFLLRLVKTNQNTDPVKNIQMTLKGPERTEYRSSPPIEEIKLIKTTARTTKNKARFFLSMIFRSSVVHNARSRKLNCLPIPQISYYRFLVFYFFGNYALKHMVHFIHLFPILYSVKSIVIARTASNPVTFFGSSYLD